MAQEWDDDTFFAALLNQFGKCINGGHPFLSRHWSYLMITMNVSKEKLVIEMKKLRKDALLFQEFLKEECVDYISATGGVSVPRYFWNEGTNATKYGVYNNKQINFRWLNEWVSIFERNIIKLDNESRSAKRKGNCGFMESSKRLKSSCEVMDMKTIRDIEQCDLIFDSLLEEKLITDLGHFKLHKQVSECNCHDASYFLSCTFEEARWCYIVKTLEGFALKEKKHTSLYI